MTKEERAVLNAAADVTTAWGVFDRRYLPASMRRLHSAVDALVKSERPKTPKPRRKR